MKTKLFNKARNDIWEESEIVMSIIARFGTGGGSEVLIIEDDVLEQGRRNIVPHITKLWGRAADAGQG